MAFLKLVAFLVLLVAASAYSNSSDSITINPPQTVPSEIQTIDSAYFSYSIELSYFVDYAGNLSHPNTLSYNLLSTIEAIAKNPAWIRVGGTTQNYATYHPNQTAALINYYSTAGSDQPNTTSIGPAYFESFKTFPNGTRYIFGLSFNDTEAGKAQTVLEARGAWEGIGESLDQFEIGNEFDFLPVNRSTDRNTTTWSLETYVSQWLEYSSAVTANLSLPLPFFSAGVFATTLSGINQPYGSTPWNAETSIDNGITSTGAAKTFCEHLYMGAACPNAGAPTPTLSNSLLNHTRLTEVLAYYRTQSAISAARGLPYIIGEGNSIACQGAPGVSDTFGGGALWSVNYALYAAATTNVSRIFLHEGTGYRYAAWQPVDVVAANGTVEVRRGVRPQWFGNVVVASALAGREGKRVVSLVGQERFTGYGVYEEGSDVLRKVVLVNLANATEAGGVGRSVTLPVVQGGNGEVEVRRLTAPAVDATDGIEWAGRTVDEAGLFVGEEQVERVAAGGTVVVEPAEVVLVSF